MIVAVRLLRKLCPSCKVETKLRRRDLDRLNIPVDQLGSVKLFTRKGCERCSRTGYSGRTGVFEILPINEELKESLRAGRPLQEIVQTARRACRGTLRGQAVQKVLMGVTDPEEIGRVINIEASRVS